jgi:hypothetical protein
MKSLWHGKIHWFLVNEYGPCMRERGRHIVDKRPARTNRSTSDMQRSLCDRKRFICEVEKGPHAKPK